MNSDIILRIFVAAATAMMAMVATAQEPGRLVSMGEGRDSVPFEQIAQLGLLVVDVATVDGEWPTCEYVNSPDDAWGKSITNATKVPGSVRVWRDGQVAYNSGDYVPNAHGMTIRIRGNSSAYYDKKPYKITLQEKGDLLLRNNPNYRDKDWVLIRDEFFKHAAGFEVNRLVGMSWTPAYRYVNLVVNDDYQGVYMLVEPVKRNNNCRVKVGKRGFLFEYDAYWWNDKVNIPSTTGGAMRYTFKYPNEDDLTDEDMEYMRQMLADYEASIAEDTYDEHIDVASFAAWCLGHDLLATSDAAGTNRFFVKNDRTPTSRLTMPVMWDFDSSEADTANWSRLHNLTFRKYFKSDNRAFLLAYVNHWRSISDTFMGKMSAALRQLRSTDGQAIYLSMQYNNQRWNTVYKSLAQIDRREQWFKQRVPWLNAALARLLPEGDMNYDGRVDVDDVNLLLNMILELTPTDHAVADVTGDGNVDVDDVNRVISIILAGEPPVQHDTIELSADHVEFDTEGGLQYVDLYAAADWSIDTADIPAWLKVEPTEGDAGEWVLSFTAQPATRSRQTTLALHCADSVATITIAQRGASAVTVADFLAAPADSLARRLSGVVTVVNSARLGIVRLADWSGDVLVCGLDRRDSLCVGDILTVEGFRGTLLGTPVMRDATLAEHLTVEEVSIPQFATMAAADSTYYRVTGTITSIDDAERGEMWLYDSQWGEIHIDACAPGWGATGDDRLGLVEARGLAVGDQLVVIGRRADDEFGNAYMTDAFYFTHRKFMSTTR